MRIRAILILLAFLPGTTDFSAAQSCFTDYGIAAAVSENRSMNAGLIDGDLYFSSGVNVWRYDLDGCQN